MVAIISKCQIYTDFRVSCKFRFKKVFYLLYFFLCVLLVHHNYLLQLSKTIDLYFLDLKMTSNKRKDITILDKSAIIKAVDENILIILAIFI